MNGTIRGFPSYLWLPVSYRILNHATGYDQVSGFTLFGTLTHPQRRIRFACAMCSLLPIASFRPCRCQQRPCDSDCLPPDQGDACILQQAGFASSAGQTKKSNGWNESTRCFFIRTYKTYRYRSNGNGRPITLKIQLTKLRNRWSFMRSLLKITLRQRSWVKPST